MPIGRPSSWRFFLKNSAYFSFLRLIFARYDHFLKFPDRAFDIWKRCKVRFFSYQSVDPASQCCIFNSTLRKRRLATLMLSTSLSLCCRMNADRSSMLASSFLTISTNSRILQIGNPVSFRNCMVESQYRFIALKVAALLDISVTVWKEALFIVKPQRMLRDTHHLCNLRHCIHDSHIFPPKRITFAKLSVAIPPPRPARYLSTKALYLTLLNSIRCKTEWRALRHIS